MTEPCKKYSSVSRRHFIGSSAALSAGLMLFPQEIFSAAAAASGTPRYRIGICDVYILKRTSIGGVQRAKDIGVEGLEPDIGSLSDKDTFNHDPSKTLLDPAQRQAYIDAGKKIGIEFPSMGMTAFLGQDFGSRPTVMTHMIPDAIETMKVMGIKIAYLPLRAKCLVKFPETRPRVVERLKATALLAEKANVIFGIETTYEGKDEVKLIDEIGSPAIRSYFNFKNPIEEGRDLIEELKLFGRERICQIHCTEEDGTLLKNNKKIDYKKAFETLNEMGYSGWLIMERGRVSSMDSTAAYQDNAKYLKSIFQGPDVPPVATTTPLTARGTAATMSLRSVNGTLYVHTPLSNGQSASVGIFNVQGRQLKSWKFAQLHPGTPLVVKPELSKGTYVVRVQMGNQIFSEQLHW